MIHIREVQPGDREWVTRLLVEHWASTRIVTRGAMHDATLLPGFVAEQDGKPAGLVTYREQGDEIEIVSLNSLVERCGIGSALVDAVVAAGAHRHCRRIWLVTTNDNMPALRFYQKRGFCLVAVHRNALEVSRRLKQEIPRIGMDGIPLHDEIELELVMTSQATWHDTRGGKNHVQA